MAIAGFLTLDVWDLINGVRGLGGDANGVQVESAFPKKLAFHVRAETREHVTSGVCLLGDMFYEGDTRGEISGDIAGDLNAEWKGTLYRGCQNGRAEGTWTITDREGNRLYGIAGGTASLLRPNPDPESQEPTSSIGSVNAIIITGGTGTYSGAIGQGTCNQLSTFNRADPSGSVISTSEVECIFRLAIGEGTRNTPLVVQIGASSTEVTIAGSSKKDAMYIDVVYYNASNHDQNSLLMRLREPPQAKLSALARPLRSGSRSGGADEPQFIGEHTWSLGNILPGETRWFQLELRVLAAEQSDVPLRVQIEGDDLERPALSDSVTVKVVR